MKKIIFCLMMFMFSVCCAEEKLSQLDFAFAMPIIVDKPNLLYQVALPDNIKKRAAFDDLRDIRIFNQEGNSLTYNLKNNTLIFVASGTPPYILAYGNSSLAAPTSEIASKLLQMKPAQAKLGSEYQISGQKSHAVSEKSPQHSHWFLKIMLIVALVIIIRNYLNKNKRR